MFCIYLRTNSDLCHLQHKLIGFYNREEKCLLRGTNWVFKISSLRFVFKRLIRKKGQIHKQPKENSSRTERLGTSGSIPGRSKQFPLPYTNYTWSRNMKPPTQRVPGNIPSCMMKLLKEPDQPSLPSRKVKNIRNCIYASPCAFTPSNLINKRGEKVFSLRFIESFRWHEIYIASNYRKSTE